MFGGQHRPGAELLAHGYANIVAPLFGGLPLTGAIARTATNVRAGGRTPIAGMVHALVILAVLLVAGDLAGALVLPALAAGLLVTALNMAASEKWREHMVLSWDDLSLLFLTLLLTLFADRPNELGASDAPRIVLPWVTGR